jgi:hypothetical protein
MTTGTYADEFAEKHYRIMVMRDSMHAVVPSAGTGFAITRKVLDAHRESNLLPEDALTEDYKLSLSLSEEGYQVHYVLERVQRVQDSGKVHWEYIATRSLFPNTFQTAVRQKTRWIFGITMQSTNLSKVIHNNKLSFIAKYSVYKDLKAKVGNILVFPGYAVFIYFLISLFINLPAIYPKGTLSYFLCEILTIIMIYRQILRAIAIGHVYGFRSVIASTLIPPVMPISMV